MTTDAVPKSPSDEVAQFRSSLNDLATILASPAVSTGGKPPHAVSTMMAGLLERASDVIAANERLSREVAEYRRAEASPRASELDFQLLVETIPALVWRGTPEGELDYLNQRAVEYLGHTAQSLANGRWIELVH